MSRQILLIAILAILIIGSQALCPASIRLVNALVPNAVSLDLIVNGQVVVPGLAFRGVSKYFSVRPGSVTIEVRQTGTTTSFGTRAFTAAPNQAFTVAATGSTLGATGQLLFSSTLFVYVESLLPPNPSTFRGVFHRLTESTGVRSFSVVQLFNGDNTIIPSITPKLAMAYPQQPIFSGGGNTFAFRVTQNNGSIVINSVGQQEALNATVSSGVIYDLFLIGDNANANNPGQLTAISTVPLYNAAEGCSLVDGISVLPDSSPFTPIFSVTPCNSGSSIAVGFAFLLAFIALFF